MIEEQQIPNSPKGDGHQGTGNNGKGQCPFTEIDSMSDEVINFTREKLKHKTGEPKRAFHTKTIGVVTGKLTVNEELKEELRAGIFKQNNQYDVWIRFTNGASKVTADYTKTARGMAIKVRNV